MFSSPLLRPRRSAAASAALATVAVGAVAIAATAGPTAARVPPTIEVGSNPSELVVSKDGGSLYVLNDGSVSIVDTSTQTQTAEFNTGFDDQTALGLTPAGRLLVGTFDSRVLKLVAPTAQEVVGQVRVGRGATGVAIKRRSAGSRAYVSLLTRRQVVVVNPRTMEVLDRIRLPRGPQSVRTLPRSRQIWAGSSYSGRIWVINAHRNQVTRRIAVGDAGPVSSIAFGPAGKRAWVAGMGGAQVVRTKTGAELAFLPAERLFPGADAVNIGEVALTPDGRRAIVLNSTFPDSPGQGAAAVVDTQTLRVVRRIRLGTEPLGLAVTPQQTYASNYADDTVSHFPTPGT